MISIKSPLEDLIAMVMHKTTAISEWIYIEQSLTLP